MFRLFFLTFHGRYNGPREVYEHAHEAPSVMVTPVAILGLLSIVGGFIQTPWGWNAFDDWLSPVFTRYAAAHAGSAPLTANWIAVVFILLVALGGIYIAYRMYGGAERRPYRGLKPIYELLYNKYYVDEAYDEAFVVPVRNGARGLYNLVDRAGIDGVVNFSARMVRAVSQALSPVETGYVRTYALSIFVGVILVALVPVVYGTLVK
jgi:NADH-quinone oxidoreductase subunit L